MMRCLIQISPSGRYDIIQSRYISNHNSSTYPASIAGLAVVGQPVRLVSKAPNYTATWLIHRAISVVLDGYAFIYKTGSGLDNLLAFSKEEAERIIQTCIQQVGGKSA